jgi:hypothetical protein
MQSHLPSSALGPDGDIGRRTWTAGQADLSMKSRTDTSADQRRDFYCYIDEFGLFASAGNSVDTMLSEARKCKLNVTLGMQCREQVETRVGGSLLGMSAVWWSSRSRRRHLARERSAEKRRSVVSMTRPPRNAGTAVTAGRTTRASSHTGRIVDAVHRS